MKSVAAPLMNRRSLIRWVGFASAAGMFAGAVPAATPPKAGIIFFNVRDQGATGDGKTLDTAPLQAAINACAGAGGDTVYFPAGTYLSGTLVLKSQVTLHLDAGATLLGSRDHF